MFQHPSMSSEHPYAYRASTDIGHGYSTRATSPTPSDRYAFSDDVHEMRSSGGILRTLSSIGHSDAPLIMPRRPFLPARGSSGSVTFDDSSTQSSPRLGARRKMMTMSASDVGHGGRFSSTLGGGHYTYPRPEVQRSKSSLSIAGRIIRKLSIGSSSNVVVANGMESESEQRPRVTRKLTRRRMFGGSTTSLPYVGDTGVPPVPPLPPGVASGKFVGRAQSEIGHGVQSDIGHGYGHSRGDSFGGQSTWGGSNSVLGHESTASHSLASPAPTRVSFTTTQSAPAGFNARNKLVKKQRQAPRRATDADLPGHSLASLDFPSGSVAKDVSRSLTWRCAWLMWFW